MKQRLVEGERGERGRTPLDEACEEIIKRLSEEPKPYSITSLAKVAQLHRKTVEKVIKLLLTEQEWLDNYRLKLLTVGNNKIITLESRTGLLSYPEDIQRLIIKTRHFPLPTPEVYLLVYLYLNDAVTPEKSIPIKGKEEDMIRRLLKQEKIKIGKQGKSRLGYYLTEEGIIVAKGTIRIFPDLEKHKKA